MHSVAIFGAGELGGAVARQLAAADFLSRIVLVDAAASVASGKALDINQAAPVDGYAPIVSGTADESAAIGVDALVLADQFQSNTEWRDDAGAMLVRRLAYLNPRALIVCAGGDQASLVDHGVFEGGLPPRQLVGSAPEGLRSSIVALTALEAGCVPRDVNLAVLGRPPAHLIVPWDEASIAGRRASVVLSPPQITRLDARLAQLWPPSPFTLASAATRLLGAAAARTRDVVSALVAPVDDRSRLERVSMQSVVVGASGIVQILPPALSVRDRVRLQSALAR